MKAPHLVLQHITCQTSVRVAHRKPKSSPAFWQQWFNQLFQWLTDSESIKVTQKCDRAGNTYYQIHNRLSGQTQTFLSQEDVSIWLDRQRFS
jgi:hypothetical protein